MPVFSYSIKKKGNEKNCMHFMRKQRIAALLSIILLSVVYIGIPVLQVGAFPGILSIEETEPIEEIKESNLYAQSAVLMDAQSGRVLYGKNSTEQLAMASTTKIMTLLIALEQGNLSDVVKVSDYAASMPDVQLNMKAGEEYILEDLLYSLMLESHNDSAVAIAEGIAGSTEAFADRMNQKAKEIGCENTCFITPNGLDATATMTDKNGKETAVFHSTTAEDLAKIMSYCITKSECKEKFLKITQTPTYTFSNCAGTRSFTCQNHNSFLYMMEGAISGKTGFTGKAGYCYVGALERDGRTFVAALLACGWPNNRSYKWKDMKKLMDYALKNYESVSFEEAMEEIETEGTISVYNGQTNRIGDIAYAGFKVQEAEEEELEGILLRKDEELVVDYEIKDSLQAPVESGTVIGNVTCKVDGQTYLERKIVVTQEIEEIDFNWCIRQVIRKFTF